METVDRQIRERVNRHRPTEAETARALAACAVEIERLTTAAPEPRSTRSIAARRPRRVLVLAVVALVVMTGVAVAMIAGEIPSPFHHEAAEHVPALRDPGAERMSDADVAAIEHALARVVRRTDVDTGPALIDLRTKDGVVLVDGAYGRVVAVDSLRGDLCFAYHYRGKQESATCVQELKPSGLVALHGSRDRAFVAGIAGEGVTAVAFELRDGSRSSGQLANNAFVWRGRDDQTPVRARVRRANVDVVVALRDL